jgi:RHS repeat-associated protein
VKTVSNGVTTYYPFPHYEVQVAGGVTTTTKYYFFAGQRIAMQRGSEPLTFLHGDHLNSTALATRGGTASGQERYYAYGKDRLATATVPTDNRFTGQKEDASGLVYMNARYYDPVTGQFVSPDTLAPPHPWCVDCRLTLKGRLPFCAEEAYKISVPRKRSGVYHHGTIRGLSAVPKHASTETRLSSHRPICVVG